ncbi:hypothetical protein SLE2022_139980 [Rubroshorea leprosula]
MRSSVGRTNIITKTTTRFHLLRLAVGHLSPATLWLCKSLLSKTLGVFFNSSMDDLFLSDDDDRLLDLYTPYGRKRPLSPRFDHFDYEDDSKKLYLVPYRWWKEVQSGTTEQIAGVSYSVSSDDESESEIVLKLRKQEVYGKMMKVEEGVSGREYALVHKALFSWTLKRYNDSKTFMKEAWGLSVAADYWQDLFTLLIRLSFSPEADSLVVKISLKDNLGDLFKRACCIFNTNSELLYIWDFSGQTNLFLLNEKVNLCNDSPQQPGKEIPLELHVHGFPVSKKERNEEKEDLSNSLLSDSSYRGIGSLGLIGLQNLGNTCFMNSAIQCLVHTPQLVDFFLGDYQKDINYKNPLGMNGELALAFGELLRKLWAPGTIPVAPRKFKLKLSSFAPQFSGYNQHDSQEFLAFLLDGLHEDLNRVKCKPYTEVKDAEGCLDEEVAEEYWRNHLARNNSIIVDVCQGQYRSMLVCPDCKKLSVTFDPFMYLTLPLPSTVMRTMTLKVISTDGIMLPSECTVIVPKSGKLNDLIDALSVRCSLRNDENLLLAEIYKNQICCWLDGPHDSLALIRDEDRLVAYRLPKDSDSSPLVVFSHMRMSAFSGKTAPNWKFFVVPFVARISDLSNGYNIHYHFLKLLNPLLLPTKDVVNDFEGDDGAMGTSGNKTSKMEDVVGPSVLDSGADPVSVTKDDSHEGDNFKFYLVENMVSTEMKMNEPVLIPGFKKSLDVHVRWPDKMIEKCDRDSLSSLPVVFRPHSFAREPQESVSLYKCLEGFLQEEPLGPDDMWFCPSCKKHQQANKKLDLWRLPEILVIHLKRFSDNWILNGKLETYVDFPIEDLDLSDYIFHQQSQSGNRYRLYAVSNHYGSMGGGHYTAFVDTGHGRWYELDDVSVHSVTKDSIKTSAAYVLFYRRVPDV